MKQLNISEDMVSYQMNFVNPQKNIHWSRQNIALQLRVHRLLTKLRSVL
jgi:hypothetical protein